MTQVTRENPPRSSVIVGSAVATIVPSSVLITWPSCRPMKISSAPGAGRPRGAVGHPSLLEWPLLEVR